jgi:hypothetical protein
VTLGFLVLDPEKLFDASFQLTFLAVAFLGAFATPLIQATSGPFTHSLRDIDETRRDLRREPRARKVPRRNAASGGDVAPCHPPARTLADLAVTFLARLFSSFTTFTTSP